MNDADFTARLTAAAVSLDDNRWLLAELAADCKAAKFEHWAEKIGHHPAVRRNARTIRSWAQVAVFRRATDNAFMLPFSAYAVGLRYLDKLPPARVIEVMGTAAEEGVSVEELAAELRTQAGREPPPPQPTADALLASAVRALTRFVAAEDHGPRVVLAAAFLDGLAGLGESGETK